MTDGESARLKGSLRWLSQDYSTLRENADKGVVYDLVIVGSGYGGAMAAYEFAGMVPKGRREALRICVLERGKEYAPGMFPSSLQELPPHVRVLRTARGKPVGRRDALLDVRVGEHVSAILGNGLGGGSLINAGVMEAPKLESFDLAARHLPAGVLRDLPGLFDDVRAELGACAPDSPNHPGLGLRKSAALQRVAQANQREFRYAAITVQTEPGNPEVPPCTGCGDCMTGCNVGAKKSLDTTLLMKARQRGVEIYTGGSVLTVSQGKEGWTLETVYTDQYLRQRNHVMPVQARHVILAAGTFGSTEILLRSRGKFPFADACLGQRFSCNGDNLVAVHGTSEPVGTTAEESQPLDERTVGPTITGIVDLGGVLLQEFAVPAPLKRLFDETVTTANHLHGLAEKPRRSASRRQQDLDSAAVDPVAMEHTLLVGVIGHDESQGRMVLPDIDTREEKPQQEGVDVQWDRLRDSPIIDRDYEEVEGLLARGHPQASVLANPVWRLLPKKMDFLVKGQRGPLLTVHPLGGCPMGLSAQTGVVDHLGRVFRPAGTTSPLAVYEDLVVLDGSIIPGSLGANPALTIASLARRAARKLAELWQWEKPGTEEAAAAQGGNVAPPMRQDRPLFRPLRECTPPPAQPTYVELIERLAGPAGKHWVELTLAYQEASLRQLASKAQRRLVVDGAKSYVRIYDNADGEARRELMTLREHERDARAIFIARVDGGLALDEPNGEGDATRRTLGALGAWLSNRGLRDAWGRLFLGESPGATFNPLQLLALAAHAGGVRRFRYTLDIGETLRATAALDSALLQPGTRVHGEKNLTYTRHGNPWLQLTELHLAPFPGVAQPAVLTVDGRFLARQGVPLLRVTRQQNQVLALADFASLAACWARILASIHMWSFRAPDAARPHKADRLPGRMRGVPAAPHRICLAVDGPQSPVRAMLTRYAQAHGQPVVLVHGYSASGTTFTHDAIPVPLAKYLWHQGFDVWVLDLRTSAGFDTARWHWNFEDAAYADLPMAIAHIRQVTGRTVDVFAHCIGAVMLSMALLRQATGPAVPKPRKPGEYESLVRKQELQALQGNIRRIVLSQKGPMLVYCDDNVLRAYFMRLLRRAILPENYQFRSPDTRDNPDLASNLMDRLLSTLPYPRSEFRRENPAWPWQRARWAGFRHRMDALYARDFSLANVSDRTLEHIEDLFGPLNLDTVAQAIHFARQNTITDAAGLPFDTSRAALQARWPRGGTLALHGEDNGLVDARTLDAMQSQMRHAGIPFSTKRIRGYGHQDCLIGLGADDKVFRHVAEHLG